MNTQQLRKLVREEIEKALIDKLEDKLNKEKSGKGTMVAKTLKKIGTGGLDKKAVKKFVSSEE